MAEKKKKKEEALEAEESVKEESEQAEQAEEAPEITVEDLINKLAELKKRADEEKQRADDMTKVAVTLRADFDNFRKRSREESAKDKEKGRIDVLEQVIPVLDVVGQALTMITDENVKKGVEMIGSQIENLLSGYGIKEIEAKGCQFDPKVHEAVMQIDGEESGTVADVFQKGYVMGDRVIRAARVIVVK